LEILLSLLRGHDVGSLCDQFSSGLVAFAVEATALFDVPGKFQEIDLTSRFTFAFELGEGLLHLCDLRGKSEKARAELLVDVANAGELLVVELKVALHPGEKCVQILAVASSGRAELWLEQRIDQPQITLDELQIARGVLMRNPELDQEKAEQDAGGGEGDAERRTRENRFQALEDAGRGIGVVSHGDAAPNFRFETVGCGRGLFPAVEQRIERIFGILHG